MIRFLNTVICGQRQTIDQLDSNDYPDYKSFKSEQKRLKSEYSLAGGHGTPYWSQRKCK